MGDSLAVGVWQPAREILQQFGLADKPLDVVYVLDGSFALGMASAIAYLQLVGPICVRISDHRIKQPDGVAVLHQYFEQSREMLALLAAEFVEDPAEAIQAAVILLRPHLFKVLSHL